MPKRVLLVDDEIHIIRASEFKFQRLGYEVVCARDGQEAWEIVQQHKPDLIVTDCQMPRLDGLGLAARVYSHAETTDIPVIMLSAKGFELSASEIREQFGIRALLPKPFSPRELVALAEQLLGQNAAPATEGPQS